MARLTQNRVELLEPLAPRLVLKAGTQWFARLGHWAATAFIVTILLAAAGLKIHSSLSSSGDGHRIIPFVIALCEILLSILLLVKRTRNSCWVAAGCLFALFASYNTYQALQSVAECGCFGTLNPSPATVLAIDFSR